ncbi:hypothetical protein [Sporomusa malonica]|uniref:Hpr(Ser) kinase/phosphatase n=1 Tax=Sporomusa malonica TaxID=112901 RepID=A0A1W2DM84_9FIRM|nr:hypothetical protein [Sporomusa malonica]SMC98162.1 hypothetical protein SAMN04488500_116112 [Sporomusa malonica]
MSFANQAAYFRTEELEINREERTGKYRYKVFGLHIMSDIQLPELLIDTEGGDSSWVNISLGKTPTSISEPVEKTESYQIAANQFLFQVPGVGCYYVTKGNSITVQPAEHAEECFVRLFLLGTALGALLMQRSSFPIHGSAVVINGGCVVFTGVSGVGKSTLLAAFREQGYSFLTDDVAAVILDADGVPWVQPAYPQQKLWRDSADTLGVNTVSLVPVYSGVNKDKFTIPVHKRFWQSPMPLVAVYELEVGQSQNVTINSFSGLDKLSVLINHTYRPWLIDGLGLKVAHFKQCAAIGKRVTVSRLTRPEGVFSLEEQVHLVKQDLGRMCAGAYNI